jgi:hypothetical protein
LKHFHRGLQQPVAVLACVLACFPARLRTHQRSAACFGGSCLPCVLSQRSGRGGLDIVRVRRAELSGLLDLAAGVDLQRLCERLAAVLDFEVWRACVVL